MKNTIYNLIPFVGIMVSIIFSGIISNEIENGTIRFYLTKPISRNKIFQSKFITIIIYTIILLVFILFCYFILCKDIDKIYIIKYVKYSCPLLLTSGLIMLLTTLFRSTSITVGISIFLLAFSLVITQILLDINFKYVEFTFLPYLDFTLFNDAETIKTLNEYHKINLSLEKGIYINVIFSILFYKLGNFVFIKKDIKN
jgi:ABC-2 type transport system permease protein